MNYRSLGSSGLSVSEVSLGSWLTFGSSVDREGTRELVEKAYDLGINLFDTADVYSKGDGEDALGYALSGIPRQYVVGRSPAWTPFCVGVVRPSTRQTTRSREDRTHAMRPRSYRRGRKDVKP